MHATIANGPRQAVRALGSLWFGAVLMVLLLVGMACATVFESSHGAEMALVLFYRSDWFKALLALLALNVLAAVVVRFPLGRRHIGFVITHVSILVILAGALVTSEIGIDGQAGIAEGETVHRFNLLDRDTLTLTKRSDSTASSVDLTSPVFRGFDAVDTPHAPVLIQGDLRVEILRYLPDSATAMQVVDNSPFPNPAVEVTLSAAGHDHPTWLFLNRPASLGVLKASFRVVDANELTQLLDTQADNQSDSDGVIKVDHGGQQFDVALSASLGNAVPLGKSGYSIRTLRYLPHATVGADNKLTNASNDPVNPAVEVELIGQEETEKRLAFSRFPDFGSMHGDNKIEGFKITFMAPNSRKAAVPVEVLSGPNGDMYVRFSKSGADVVVRRLAMNTPVETPWSGQNFTLMRRFERARSELAVTPKEPGKSGRSPALRLKLSTAKHSSEMWVQKFRGYPVTVDGVPYELAYANKTLPLGFGLTLNKFTIRYYPGGMRPRSFESQITINDPTGGEKVSRVVSMNSPVEYGGYTLYQSSYRQDPGRTISFLSVARDPGLVIVFIGYGGIIVGMLIVLGTRMMEHRNRTPGSVSDGVVQSLSVTPVGQAAHQHITNQGRSKSNVQTSSRRDPMPASTKSRANR